MRATSAACLSLLLGALASCSSTEAVDESGSDVQVGAVSPSADEAKACEEGSVGPDANGDSVVKCTKPFATAPRLHLPADTVGKTLKFYGGITTPSTADFQIVIWDRTGHRFVPVDAGGKPLDFTRSGFPKALHAPTNRVLTTIYQFEGTTSDTVETPFHGTATKIRLKSVRPVVEIDGCVLDSQLLGGLDGDVSERLEHPIGGGPMAVTYDPSKRVPIHLTLTSMEKEHPLNEFTDGTPIADASTHVLHAKIDNLDKDVTVDGKTYPSLAAMGSKNPFLGATDDELILWRAGNMHGLVNDSHWAVNYPANSQTGSIAGMSESLAAFSAPWYLLSEEAAASESRVRDAFETIEILPHIPARNNGNTLVLRAGSIGASLGKCPR